MERKIYNREDQTIFKSNEREKFIMNVTPAIASEIYAKSGGNRKESTEHVKYLASQMREGKWDHDKGLGVGFNKEGKLKNGHHTLLAVIEYGQAIDLKFMIGYDDEFFKEGFDSGKARSVRDSCEMNLGSGTGKYANFFKNIVKIRNNGFPTNCGAKIYDKEARALEPLYNSEGERLMGIYNEWERCRKHDVYALRGVSVAEPATLVAIMSFLIIDCKQDESSVFDFCKKVMSEKSIPDNNNMEFLRFILNKARSTKSAQKFKIEFPDFFKLFARTYLIETGCIKKRAYQLKKYAQVKQMLEAEEASGYAYDPEMLKDVLLLRYKKVA